MKKWLSNNLLLKVFSLLFAGLFWFYLTSEQESELGFPVAIELSGLPSSLVVSEGKIDHATIWLRGVRRNLFNLRSEKMTFKVNLEEAGEGIFVYPLTEEGIDSIPDVLVEKIVPPVLNLKLEKLIKKRLAVKPKIKGSVPRGYEFINATVSPDFIQVRGRRSVLQGMKNINTYPVDISSITQPSNFEVPVDVSLSELNVTSDSKMIKVFVSVKESIINKTFFNIPVSVINLETGYTVDVDPVSAAVEVRGSEILLDNLKPVDIRVLVSAKDLPDGMVYKRRAAVEVPEKFSFLNVTPNLFSIKKVRVDK